MRKKYYLCNQLNRLFMISISERILKNLCLFIDNIGNRLLIFLFFLFFSVFFCSKSLFSQNYTYQNYNIQQGLAGSVAYGMLQDKEGFMWIATETGLSRFDGTHFRTFTTADGLPDNDIMSVFEDSKGRIWILSFKNKLCFYQNGVFHTEENTPWLKIALPSPPLQIIEDKEGDLLLRMETTLLWISFNDKAKFYSATDLIALASKKITPTDGGNLVYIANTAEKGFLINVGIDFYVFRKGKIEKKKLSHSLEIRKLFISPTHYCYKGVNENYFYIHNIKDSTYKKIPLDFNIINVQFLDNNIFINTNNGSYQYDCAENQIINHFLPDKNMLGVCKDREDNYWFSTRGNGVFRLQSAQISSFDKDFFDDKGLEVFHIKKNKNKLWIGANAGKIFSIDYLKNFNIEKYKLPNNKLDEDSRIPYLHFLADDKLLAFSNSKIWTILPNIINLLPFKKRDGYPQLISSLKSVAIVNKDSMIIAAGNGIHSYTISTNKIEWFAIRERITCSFYRNDSLFYGTMQGLKLQLSNKKNIILADKNQLLKEKFTNITSDKNQNIWLSSYNNGVICIKKIFIKT